MADAKSIHEVANFVRAELIAPMARVVATEPKFVAKVLAADKDFMRGGVPTGAAAGDILTAMLFPGLSSIPSMAKAFAPIEGTFPLPPEIARQQAKSMRDLANRLEAAADLLTDVAGHLEGEAAKEEGKLDG